MEHQSKRKSHIDRAVVDGLIAEDRFALDALGWLWDQAFDYGQEVRDGILVDIWIQFGGKHVASIGHPRGRITADGLSALEDLEQILRERHLIDGDGIPTSWKTQTIQKEGTS